MAFAFRRLLVLVAVITSSWIAYGCSGSPEAAAGATGTSGTTEPAFIDVQFTATSVIISNRAGMPIKDLVIALKPSRGSMSYETRIDRMESTQKKEIPLLEFKSGGGIPWRSGKPKEITASATDVAGAKRNMAVPVS